MKVMLICNYLRPYVIGGAEINVEKTAIALSKRHEVVVVTSSQDNKDMKEEMVSPSMKIIRINPHNVYSSYPPGKHRPILLKLLWWLQNLWNPFVYFNIRRIIHAECPDRVFLHNFYGLSHSTISAISASGLSLNFVPHDFYMICKNSSFMLKNGNNCIQVHGFCHLWVRWNRYFIGKVKTFLFLSDYQAALFKKTFGVSGPVRHNTNFMTKDQIEQIRRKKEGDKEHIIITFLYIGRLDEYKGTGTLLEAIKLVNVRNIRFVFAGCGEYEREIIRNSAYDKRIEYRGFVTGDDKENEFSLSDVLLFPSQCYEVSPLVVQEAYVHGMPVIASDIGSIPEHIDDGYTGIIFKAGDSGSLAKAITAMCDYTKISSMKKACYDKALSNTVEDYVNYLESPELS